MRFLIYILFFPLAGVIFLLFVLLLGKSPKTEPDPQVGMSFATPWITEADSQRRPGDPVIGSLGGMSVTIPPGVAYLVEYDGDPGWGEKRKGKRPVRTHQSVLRSFGFEARFPGMENLASAEMRRDMKSFNIYNTPWLSVGITAGSEFGDGYFFERHYKNIVQVQGNGPLKRAENQFGLEYYEPDVPDEKKFKPPFIYKYYYFHKDSHGNVRDAIDCSTVPHDAAPCTQTFYLEEMPRVKVYVSYRIGMLPEWQRIKRLVSKTIVNFKTKGD